MVVKRGPRNRRGTETTTGPGEPSARPRPTRQTREPSAADAQRRTRARRLAPAVRQIRPPVERGAPAVATEHMRDRRPSWLRYVARETVAERNDKRRPRVPAQLRKEPGLSAAATTRPTPPRTAQQAAHYAIGNARQRRRRHATRARNAARTHDTFCASTRSAKPAAHRRATRPRTPSRQVQRDSDKSSSQSR